jgi:cytochrome c2
MNRQILLIISILGPILFTSTNGFGFDGPGGNKGYGPISDAKLGPIDENNAKKGREIFVSKCSACHKINERYVGPNLKDVTKRRTPEWILNQILNPVEQSEKDQTAKDLLAEYMTQMTFQNISEPEARSLLEFFRRYDEKGDFPQPKTKKTKSK